MHLFPKGKPNKAITRPWWDESMAEIFPEKTRDELDKLFEETRQIRDIPITEQWQVILTLDH